jgi:hypothetical protein
VRAIRELLIDVGEVIGVFAWPTVTGSGLLPYCIRYVGKREKPVV